MEEPDLTFTFLSLVIEEALALPADDDAGVAGSCMLNLGTPATFEAALILITGATAASTLVMVWGLSS